jgi:hypothetical protein
MRVLLRILLLFPLILTACNWNDSPVIESDVDTHIFDGSYLMVESTSISLLEFEIERTEDKNKIKDLHALIESEMDRYSNFNIDGSIIRSGKTLVQEFSLISAIIEDNTLEGRAIWHEDVHDPGDMIEVIVELRFEGDLLYFSNYEVDSANEETIVLVKDLSN